MWGDVERPTWGLAGVGLGNGFVAAFPSAYHSVIFNSPAELFRHFLRNSSALAEPGAGRNPLLWSATVALFTFASVTAAAAFPAVSRLGCKLICVGLASGLGLLGNTLIIASKYHWSFELLLLGRLLAGIGSGLSLAFVPVFINQISSPHFSGPCNVSIHIFYTIGIFAASAVSSKVALGTRSDWEHLFTIPLVLCALHLLSFPLYPESPRFYARRAQYDRMAASHRFYSRSPDVDALMETFNEEQRKEAAVKMSGSPLWRHRRLIAIGMVASVAQTLSGYMAQVSYSTLFMQELGLSLAASQGLTVAFSLFSLLVSVAAVWLVERAGRRPIMLGTIGLIALSNAAFFGLSYVVDAGLAGGSGLLGVAFLGVNLLFLVAFNLGPGSISNFISSEIVPAEAAAPSAALGFAANFTAIGLTQLGFYPLQQLIGAYTFLGFAFANVALLGVLWAELPETRVTEGPTTSPPPASATVAALLDTEGQPAVL